MDNFPPFCVSDGIIPKIAEKVKKFAPFPKKCGEISLWKGVWKSLRCGMEKRITFPRRPSVSSRGGKEEEERGRLSTEISTMCKHVETVAIFIHM